MPLLQQFKFQERFIGDDFVKFISMQAYDKIYKPTVEIPHTHNYYLIMFITRGSGKHFIDFKDYPIHENALYFLAPGQMHHMHRSPDTDGYDVIFEEKFFCSGTSKNEILLPPPFFRNGLTIPYLKLDNMDSQYILSLLNRIKAEYENKDVASWEIIRGILSILINRIENMSVKQINTEHPKYKKAFKIVNDFRTLIEETFASEKSISFYADKLNISQNHLTETLREVTGETPVESIRRRTMLEAKRVLLENKLSIKEISYKLGYETPSYFIKLFKEETGFTPAEFRAMATSL